MRISDFIKPGDKIDIYPLHQNNEKKYLSSVFDFLDDNEVEIAMPTDEGKMVMFQKGFQGQFYFYASKGVYTCEAVVTDRYRRGNFYLVSIRIRSALKKFQRREFYRFECSIDFIYYKIPDAVAALETTAAIFEEITNPEYADQKRLARTRDISGGGGRFTVMEPLAVGSKLLSVIHLVNEKMDRTFYLVTEVIACDRIEKVQNRWLVRARWEFKNIKERDLIIRYVFEEDRKVRQKENGGKQ